MHLIYIYQHFRSPHQPLWYPNYSFQNFHLCLLSTNLMIMIIHILSILFFDLKGIIVRSTVLHFHLTGSTLSLAHVTIQFDSGILRVAKLLVSHSKGIAMTSAVSYFRPMESILLPAQWTIRFNSGTSRRALK